MIFLLYFGSVLLAFIYIFIIIHIWTAWQEIAEWEVSPGFKPDTKISVIIPYRNEKDNLGQCCSALLRNNYPKNLLEIIAVDDHSTDGSAGDLPSGVVTLKNSGEGKKAALSTGIQAASGKLILTTDADCAAPKELLRTLASYYEYTGNRLIVGMVALKGRKNVLEYFQIMDTCGVMGLHGAGIHNSTHFLANGANLAFEKSLFLEVQPYADNMNTASGDDVFFVHKVGHTSPECIGFLKTQKAVVTGNAQTSWDSLLRQRRRWASKNGRFSQGIYKWMTGLIWLLSLSITLNLLLIPFTAGLSLFVALTQLLIKGAMDFLYLQNMCKFFKKGKTLKYFIPAFLVQTLYVIAMGTFAIIGGSYQWKGRKVN